MDERYDCSINKKKANAYDNEIIETLFFLIYR